MVSLSALRWLADQDAAFAMLDVLPQGPHKDWKLKRSEIKGYVNMVENLTLVPKR
jgi:hypothetical protein